MAIKEKPNKKDSDKSDIFSGCTSYKETRLEDLANGYGMKLLSQPLDIDFGPGHEVAKNVIAIRWDCQWNTYSQGSVDILTVDGVFTQMLGSVLETDLKILPSNPYSNVPIKDIQIIKDGQLGAIKVRLTWLENELRKRNQQLKAIKDFVVDLIDIQ